MRCFISVLLAIISVIALGSAGSAASGDVRDTLCTAAIGVIPGVGIGSIHIGDQLLDTVRRLGQPTGMWFTLEHDVTNATPIRFTRPEDGLKGFVWADYGPNERFVEIRAIDNVIRAIELKRIANCADPYGIGLNSPGSRIVDQYGQSYSMRDTGGGIAVVYDAAGIRFNVAKSAPGFGPVQDILVFSPGHFCDVAGYAAVCQVPAAAELDARNNRTMSTPTPCGSGAHLIHSLSEECARGVD